MQDLQQTLTQILDYVKGVWIKKRYVIIFSWLICPLGFLYVASLPDVYSSKAQVFVDTRSVLQPLLRGLAIQTNPDQEIQMMAKTLLSRSNVEKIARESDLDITTVSDLEFETLVTELSDEIKLSSTGRDNIYNISFSNELPSVAQRVVQETLDLFVEGALGNNRKDTDTAGRFLDEQIAEYESRLTEAEQRLANFKRQYNDILPLAGTYYSSLQNLNNELESTRLQIKQTQQQTESLNKQISNAKRNDSFGVTNQEETVLRTRYDDRIRSLEEELDRLTLRFTDAHPDVVETRALLSSLEESREKEIEAFLSNEDDGNNAPLSELNREIKLEASRLESQIASLRVKETDLARKITELESKVDLIPQIEAESSALNRDYDVTKRKYEELLARKESADLSRRADVSAEDLQFRIIEPPLLPKRPSGPNRLIFYTAVLVIGFGSGIGIAFLISQLNPILIRPKQLLNVSDYPIWGTVTHLNIEQINKTNRTRLIVFLLSSGTILAMYGALVAAEIMNIDLFGGLL
ncbi:XrtA system polysaccharide chain length determinant [Alteromonas mediterranea]|uniref:Chain-length determining protein n=1 Tax=Alteromonas mediterranea TaxID=314275 RepID=A0AAC8XL88_9ALTE|nr:XrtA system polysaccharide chain length determinant [Alteromonas mediterranea]AFV86329.1 lipopolysaccharide biosynthesis protein [Alteromonas mediterranea DE1]AGP98341.1 lipopolysaccharide biosynthesis protein [Alteromonas mediterranea UM7]AGQ02596.1 lipopolysaccharide biosynthesis protein [Alteromonas mediterranea UM4b]AMJ79324.1 chain-length determining protein [Alteromonas mediterranea]AMJ83468.1 chain-length determining protein [Alteromonas mediterranea]